MSLISELLGGAGTAYLTQEGIEQARKLPTQLGQAATDIATRVGQAAEFRPYTVTTGVQGGKNKADHKKRNKAGWIHDNQPWTWKLTEEVMY